MNTIPFLNPYQMALIERKYRGICSAYAKQTSGAYVERCNEYLIDFFQQYYTGKRMPTMEAISDIHTQVRILYKITTDREFPSDAVFNCVARLAQNAYFPDNERIGLAYILLTQECVYAVISGRDSILVDKEKCEVFIRNGWLSEKARYPECISARHEPRYEVFYKEDFAVYKDPVNDCVCP